MATVKLVNVNKVYGKGVHAVTDFNIDIKDKEFIVFVGPSGCGKSTTLRMIAGLEQITSGELYIDGKLSNNIAPKDRNLAMVFQSYALYPHMTVYKNMAFGLKIRKVPKDEIDRRVKEAAEILGITEYLKRKPAELSGGQRQRVALGRAIVRNCGLFLMDEPLSNLDAKLRVQMRSEIVKLHQRIGCTTIYVTHDQTEAMTMATRIVVMKDGIIQQIGTPDEIYHHPVNKFVAGFIGSPAMNFFNVIYNEEGYFIYNSKRHYVKEGDKEKLKDYATKEIIVGIRPENIKVTTEERENSLKLEVDISETLGSETYIYFNIKDKRFVAKVPYEIKLKPHDIIYVSFEEDKYQFFNKDTEKSLLWEDVNGKDENGNDIPSSNFTLEENKEHKILTSGLENTK